MSWQPLRERGEAMKTFLLGLFCVHPLIAAPPVLNMMEPWGGQRGKAVMVTLMGTGLSEGVKIVSTLPATFTPLSPPPEMAGKRLPFLVELKGDAPVGLYPVRIESAQGISNVLLFSVGGFAEIREVELKEASNDTTATAEEVKSAPITVNGTLHGADRDYFKIYGKAGERRVIEVEARRMGSAVDPAIRILDSTGKLITRVEDTPGLGVDCRIAFTFPREGSYFVEVHDARFSDQAANFYRLKMGSYSFADGVFPLGGRRGSKIDVELFGGNLKMPAKASVDLSDAKKDLAWVNLPDATGSLPLQFAVSDLPEIIEPAGAGPHALTLGTVVNGRIAKARERDRYKLAVMPGKTYALELQARDLGSSRLDGVITVSDLAGKRLDSAGDQPAVQSVFATISGGDISRDPFVMFKAPEKVKEVIITVDDLAGEGGPAYGYRLLARQQEPDFELSLSSPFINVPSTGAAIVPVNMDRRGYGGPVQLKIANLPDDLVAGGGVIPAEVQDIDNRGASRRGVLTVSAKPGAKARMLDLEVWGEATLPDGTVVRKKASGPGMLTAIRTNQGFDPGRRQLNRPFQATWLGFDLPTMVGYETPGYVEVFTPTRLRIIQGERQEFYWKYYSKVAGGPRPDAVTSETPGGRDLRISDRVEPKRPGSGMVQMNTTIGTPASTFDMIISARVGDEVIYAPAVTVDVVQGYYVDAPKQSATLRAGGKVELVGSVRRERGFNGPVTVAPDALPLQVSCANGVVPEGSTEYRIVCEAGADAPIGAHQILLNPSSILPEGDKGKVPYKIAAVEATLVVGK